MTFCLSWWSPCQIRHHSAIDSCWVLVGRLATQSLTPTKSPIINHHSRPCVSSMRRVKEWSITVLKEHIRRVVKLGKTKQKILTCSILFWGINGCPRCYIPVLWVCQTIRHFRHSQTFIFRFDAGNLLAMTNSFQNQAEFMRSNRGISVISLHSEHHGLIKQLDRYVLSRTDILQVKLIQLVNQACSNRVQDSDLSLICTLILSDSTCPEHSDS